MKKVSMLDMLQAGVHFGHQTRYWNPKMSEYIFGSRDKIHIINLEKTLPMFNDAMSFVKRLADNNSKVLFVGTKRAARDIVREQAERCGMPYVNHRWLGGMLTNYKTVRQSIKRLKELESMRANGLFDKMTKKEALMKEREMAKLELSLGGIKNMGGLPDAIFIIDAGFEKNAIAEAKKLRIPVIGVVDTNNSPNDIDYLIPGNDDAYKAINLYIGTAADIITEARSSAKAKASQKEAAKVAAKEAAAKEAAAKEAVSEAPQKEKPAEEAPAAVAAVAAAPAPAAAPSAAEGDQK